MKISRSKLPPGILELRQAEMMAVGRPDDPCYHCGCLRKHHKPKPTFSHSKSGGSSGRSHEIPVLAPTSCDCPYCLCDCVEFIEPEFGQSRMQCTYAPVLISAL